MTKYKLIMKDDNYKNTLEFEADGLEDVVANMEIFLKGCGFFFDGILDIHTGEPETNAMHGTTVKMRNYRYEPDTVFDDIIKNSDELNMEMVDEKNIEE